MKTPRPSPKQEAIEALKAAHRFLDSPGTTDGFRLSMIRGALEYAQGRVEQIQELRRTRKEKPS